MLKSRLSIADDIAVKAGLEREYIKAGIFTFMVYQRFGGLSDKLSIYIEGDGRAWESKHRLSSDPTPLDPVGLRLAVVDPTVNLAYIARPGQYHPIGTVDCSPEYWSEKRFAVEVIESMSRVIDILKEKSKAKYVGLVGYSGGGGVAALIASYRSDVTSLRTVAGNLDIDRFCDYHKVSRLNGSLNPLDIAQEISSIPQLHFFGVNDKIVPLFVSRDFIKKLGKDKVAKVVDGVTHSKGWDKHWQELLLIELE